LGTEQRVLKLGEVKANNGVMEDQEKGVMKEE
jgi:hypothetical protein